MKRKAKKDDVVVFEIDDEPLHLGILTGRGSTFNFPHREISLKYNGRDSLIFREHYCFYEQFPEDFIDRKYVHLKLTLPWLLL